MGIKKIPGDGGVPVPHSTCPPPTPLLPRKVLSIFFALPSMNGPLPAELKFRENPAYEMACALSKFGMLKLTFDSALL